MQKMRNALWLVLFLASIGCRSHSSQPEHLVSGISFDSPSDPKRFLRGFASPNSAARFTKRVFAVALDRPTRAGTSTFLEMKFSVPVDRMEPAGQAAVTMRANGIEVCKRFYRDTSAQLLTCLVPENALKKQPVEIEVETDRAFRDSTTGEERALEVVSLGLKEYESTEESQIRSAREGYGKIARELNKLPPDKARALGDPFYRLPVWQHLTYQGIPTTKNPFDQWMIQQIIYETKPEFIIDAWTGTGASALYYAATLRGGGISAKILTVDSSDRHGAAQANPLWGAYVEFLPGSATDAEIVKKIGQRVKNRRTLVMLEFNPSTEQVLEALRSYAPFVSKESYLLVEAAPLDGAHAKPAGTSAAIQQFLQSGGNQQFEQDASREMFLWTSMPGAWLKRK